MGLTQDSDRAAARGLSRRLDRRGFLRLASGTIALPLLGGLLAACGGSSSSSTSSASSAATTAATATATGSATAPAGASTPLTTPAASTPTTGAGTPVAGASTPSALGPVSTGSSDTGYTIEPPKKKGGRLIHGSSGDAKTLNPVTVTDTISNTVIPLIFEALVQVNPRSAEAMPQLAKSWEIATDGLTYAFTLNDGVTWQDGQPLTAADVKFTYDLSLNPDVSSPSYSELHERIKTVDAPTDSQVVFSLNKPSAPFLISDCTNGVVPQHILKDVAPKQIPQHPFSTGKKGVTVGTGPFMFSEWVKDDHLQLVKYPGYWQGEPYLDEWYLKATTDQTVLTQQLKTGEVDVAGIQPSDYDSMKKQSNIDVSVYDTFAFWFWCYQLDTTKTTLFQDKAVRQALFYAVDRDRIIQTVNFGLATNAVGTMPKLSWAYNPDGIKLKYPYDVDKAKQLLDQAGWKAGADGVRAKNGKRLSFTVYTQSGIQAWEQYLAIFQQQWKAIGVEMTPKTEEVNALLTRITTSFDFEMFFIGFGWGTDPDQTVMWACDAHQGGFNMGKYCNPQVDKLLADGLATTDHAKRKAIYTEMQNILMDDLPNAVFDFPKSVAGLNKRVHNYFPNAVNGVFDAHKWWVE